MNKEEVVHLAKLARIELTQTEIDTFTEEMSAILSYVSAVKDIAGDISTGEPKPGARFNVFRRDEITNEADEYTGDLLAEMPKTEGRFMVVKKILNTDSQ